MDCFIGFDENGEAHYLSDIYYNDIIPSIEKSIATSYVKKKSSNSLVKKMWTFIRGY